MRRRNPSLRDRSCYRYDYSDVEGPRPLDPRVVPGPLLVFRSHSGLTRGPGPDELGGTPGASGAGNPSAVRRWTLD